MSLKAGIVGLPNVGKSTLFNAITNSQVEAANYPFATINPNVGVVYVKDKRIDLLKSVFNPEKVWETSFEFIDIAGLVKGASSGEGLGIEFLSHIRQVDAICHVIRCFENSDISHVEGNVDPIRDLEIINLELILADHQTIKNILQKNSKKFLGSKNKEVVQEWELLKRIELGLQNNQSVRDLKLDEQERFILKSYNFLTLKPILYVANIGENDLISGVENKWVKMLKEYAEKEKVQIITVCAEVEAQISSLNNEEKEIFLEEFNIKQSGLELLTLAAYELLNLATYFTAGKKEVRAWTFKKGMNAVECAGIIHTDFAKGFIRAEIYNYDDLVVFGNEKAIKENGKLRLEGKNYLFKDGDICYFRFNV